MSGNALARRPRRDSPAATPAATTRLSVPSLLVDGPTAAALCSISPATWARMVSAGKTPAPVRLSGGCVRYRRADLERWVAMGCPERKQFEAEVSSE